MINSFFSKLSSRYQVPSPTHVTCLDEDTQTFETMCWTCRLSKHGTKAIFKVNISFTNKVYWRQYFQHILSCDICLLHCSLLIIINWPSYWLVFGSSDLFREELQGNKISVSGSFQFHAFLPKFVDVQADLGLSTKNSRELDKHLILWLKLTFVPITDGHILIKGRNHRREN